jgi:allophanate hydrolase subunit 1
MKYANSIVGLCYALVLSTISIGIYQLIDDEHHNSTLASGILAGVALSTIVAGVQKDIQQQKHDAELDELYIAYNTLRIKRATERQDCKHAQQRLKDLETAKKEYDKKYGINNHQKD